MQPAAGVRSSRTRLHSSIESHLSTELALLQALKQRSKDQHGNQIFYRRISEILRLGKRVQEVVPAIRNESVESQELLQKFISALVKATHSTEQIIELRHFLPLQITLLGIYSRLFTIVSNVAMVVGLDPQGLISGKQAKAVKAAKQPEPSASTVQPMDLDLDLGQRLQRPIVASSSTSRSVKASPKPREAFDTRDALPEGAPASSTRSGHKLAKTEKILDSDGPVAVVSNPKAYVQPVSSDAPRAVISNKRQTDDPRPTKSKKKRNAMDDIFG